MRDVEPSGVDDGSSALPGSRSTTTMSSAGWKRVASAQSTSLSSVMSTSSSTAMTVFRYGSQPSRPSIAWRASPARRCRTLR